MIRIQYTFWFISIWTLYGMTPFIQKMADNHVIDIQEISIKRYGRGYHVGR